MTNRTRWLVTAAVGLAIVAPALLPGGADGFPVISYFDLTAFALKACALALKQQATPQQTDLVQRYQEARQVFLKREWQEAKR